MRKKFMVETPVVEQEEQIVIPEVAEVAEVEVEVETPVIIEEPKKSNKYKVLCDLNLRSGAGLHYPAIRVLNAGSEVEVLDTVREWADLGEGYCLIKFLENI